MKSHTLRVPAEPYVRLREALTGYAKGVVDSADVTHAANMLVASVECADEDEHHCPQIEEQRAAVLKWAGRFTPGVDIWDTEDVHDLEAALNGTVEAVENHKARAERAEKDLEDERRRCCGDLSYECAYVDRLVAEKDVLAARVGNLLREQSAGITYMLERNVLKRRLTALADEWESEGQDDYCSLPQAGERVRTLLAGLSHNEGCSA